MTMSLSAVAIALLAARDLPVAVLVNESFCSSYIFTPIAIPYLWLWVFKVDCVSLPLQSLNKQLPHLHTTLVQGSACAHCAVEAC